MEKQLQLTEQEKQHFAERLETVEKALLDGSIKSLMLSANLGEDSINILLGNAMDVSVSFAHLIRQKEQAVKFIYATANTLNDILNNGSI